MTSAACPHCADGGSICARTTPVAAPGRSLTAAMLGFFVVTLDALVVSVALPAIRDTFGGGITGLQWVMNGYTLPFAAMLLFAGTLSDRIGARQAYRIGLLAFAASCNGSLVPRCGGRGGMCKWSAGTGITGPRPGVLLQVATADHAARQRTPP